MSSDSDSSGPVDRNPRQSSKSKKKQTGKEPEAKKRKHETKSKGTDSDDPDRLELGGSKYVTVSSFKRQARVDIREFYTDKESGEVRPGRKGVSLSEDQWEKLKELVDDVDRKLENLK